MVSNTTFSYAILSWFRDNGRALPWRDTTEPYPIWLSEVILQQTRIAQGWEYWERFMRHFPTVEALASASEDEVLRLWQGLGYYSRARNLHAAARQIVALGQFPSTLEGIRQLKGVGDYTAAAIASFAFGIRAAVVDGNVYRVLSRHFGISTPINSTQGKKEFAALAQSLLPPSEVSAYNQGIMDFGALQCTPLSPRCSDCPLMECCEAFRTGRVEELPVKQRKLQINFLMIVMLISMFIFTFLGWPSLLERIASRVVLMPVIAGVSYEIIRFAGAHNDNKLVHFAIMPGLLLQKLTTRQPDDSQIEVAIASLKAVLPPEEIIE